LRIPQITLSFDNLLEGLIELTVGCYTNGFDLLCQTDTDLK
jgi:hypothetical protein